MASGAWGPLPRAPFSTAPQPERVPLQGSALGTPVWPKPDPALKDFGQKELCGPHSFWALDSLSKHVCQSRGGPGGSLGSGPAGPAQPACRR